METDGAAVCTVYAAGAVGAQAYARCRCPFPSSSPFPCSCPSPSSPTAYNSEVNLFFIRAALLLPVDDDDAEYRIPSTRCAVLGPASHRDIYLFSFLQAEFSVEPQLLRRRRRRRWVLCFIWCHVCSFQLQPVQRFSQTQADPTAAAWMDGTDCLPAWTDTVSSSVVMLLSFCYAQLARFWFIFSPPHSVCVW